MTEVPLILVTNDDGIDTAGLVAAAAVALRLGEVIVAAPASQQSAMARAFPRYSKQGAIERRPIRVEGRTVDAYAVEGSPAQTVAHGVLEIYPRRPDLCISGINNGENLGGTTMVSGTVGAAAEAAAFGIPSLAVGVGPEAPLAECDTRDWSEIVTIVGGLAERVLRCGLPPRVAFLNVNIPIGATISTEIRTTFQSRHDLYRSTRPKARNLAAPFRLETVPTLDTASLEVNSDLHAFFVDNVVSVTPMGFDLTVRDDRGAPVHFDFAREGD